MWCVVMSCRIARYDWKPFISTVFLSVGYHSFRTYAFCIQLEAGIQSIPGNNRRCCNGQFCVLGTNKSWFHSYKNNVGSLLLPQSIFLRRLYESYIMIHPLCIRPHKQLIIYMFQKKANKQSLFWRIYIVHPPSPLYFFVRRCIVPNSVRRPPDAIHPEVCPSVHLKLGWPPVIVFVRSRRSFGNM